MTPPPTVAFRALSWPVQPVLSAVSLSPLSPWRPVWTVQSCRWRSAQRRLVWTGTSERGWPKNPCSLSSHPGRKYKKSGQKIYKATALSSHLTLVHTCDFLGAMGVLGSCLIMLSCCEQGGAEDSGRRETGREPSNDFKPNVKWGINENELEICI